VSWTEDLAQGVRGALQRGSAVRIAVHSEAQAELGRRSAKRLVSQVGGDAQDLTFEVIPEAEQEQYPIGAVLVP